MKAEVVSKRTMGTRSAETSAIANVLRRLSVDDVIDYEALSEAVGFNVLSHRHSLQSAQRAVLRGDGIKTAVVRGVGIRRLSDLDAGRVCLSSALSKSRNAARRGLAVAERLDYSRVDQTERAGIMAKHSLLQLVDSGLSSKGQSKALAVTNEKDAIPSLPSLLAALKE